MRKVLLLLTACFFTLSLAACSQNQTSSTTTSNTAGKSSETRTSPSESTTTPNASTIKSNADLRQLSGKQIQLTIGDQSFTVNLYDNPTANDLYEQLPLTLSVNDYAGWDEKVIRLDEKLSMQDAPDGDEPLYPEVGYYEPGNWIALYYGEIGYWSGKVPLGRIDATIDELEVLPDSETIEIIRKNQYKDLDIGNTSLGLYTVISTMTKCCYHENKSQILTSSFELFFYSIEIFSRNF